jgi:hypothetical protein
VITFGAEQIELLRGEEAYDDDTINQLKQSYFNWFYFFVNFGSIAAFLGMSVSRTCFSLISQELVTSSKIFRFLLAMQFRCAR